MLSNSFGLSNRVSKQEQDLYIYFPSKKRYKIKLGHDTTCRNILLHLNKKYKSCFMNITDYSIAFVHYKYGEKIMDEYECPLQLLENLQEKFLGSVAHKLFSRKVTTREGESLLRYFDRKASYVFYVKRIFYPSSAYIAQPSWKPDQIVFMFHQLIFEMKQSQIILGVDEYKKALGVCGIVFCGNLNNRKPTEIVPYPSIKQIIPQMRQKEQKQAVWEE